MKPYTVQHRTTEQFLQSPHPLGRGQEFWFWSGKPADAHHFPSRTEARATLRQILPNAVLDHYRFSPVKQES